MNISVINLGCKVNRVESDTILQHYLDRGYFHSSAKDADLIVINTCTVTATAEKKTRKAVHRALKENPEASIIVTGCAAAIDPHYYLSLDSRISVVDKAILLDNGDYSTSQAPDSKSFLRVGADFPTRVGIKVQDGCDHNCTYCIVHVARGKAWSKSISEVLNEALALERAGVREIVLTGIDLGSYRFDGFSLVDLLSVLLDQTSKVRFRLSSIEPCSIEESLITLLAQSEGRICRHLHIPLQSGSSKVLSEMNRPYDADYYLKLVDKLRSEIPHLSLTTDVIVGFPGETDKDFEETLALVNRADFSKIHVFRYSKRVGTPAADRNDQIPPLIKAERSSLLSKQAEKLRLDFAHSLLGMKEGIVIEENGYGMSESYYRCLVPKSCKVGELRTLRLTEVLTSSIMKAC